MILLFSFSYLFCWLIAIQVAHSPILPPPLHPSIQLDDSQIEMNAIAFEAALEVPNTSPRLRICRRGQTHRGTDALIHSRLRNKQNKTRKKREMLTKTLHAETRKRRKEMQRERRTGWQTHTQRQGRVGRRHVTWNRLKLTGSAVICYLNESAAVSLSFIGKKVGVGDRQTDRQIKILGRCCSEFVSRLPMAHSLEDTYAILETLLRLLWKRPYLFFAFSFSFSEGGLWWFPSRFVSISLLSSSSFSSSSSFRGWGEGEEGGRNVSAEESKFQLP